MRIASVLKRKGAEIHTIEPQAPADEAVRRMVQNRIGSLVVMEGDRPVSIITERDVLQALDAHGSVSGLRVADLMAKHLVMCGSVDTVDKAMGLMTHNVTGRRIRHLPVIDGGRLVGMLSIGDVVEALLTEATFENRLLKNYIKHWPEEDTMVVP
jgi:CBS domain-containing protein